MKSKMCFLGGFILTLWIASTAFGYVATFNPRISINEEYNDNIFLTDTDKEYDFITSISPGFSIDCIGKISGFGISYDPQYTFYDRYSNYDTWRHNASLSAWTGLTKYTKLELNDSFIRTEDPLSEIDNVIVDVEDYFLEDNTIRRSREPYYSNTAGLNLTHQFGELDSLRLKYLYSILENEDPKIEDNIRHSPSVGLSFWFNPHLGFETQVGYTRGEFDISDNFDQWKGSIRLIKKFTKYFEGFVSYAHTLMEYKGESENYKIYDPSVGIHYTIDEDTMLSLSIGYYVQDRENSEDESGISLKGNLGKTWRLKRGSINLSGSSGYEENYFGAENLGFDAYYQGECSANYSFSQHISSYISGSFRRDKYLNLDENRKDRKIMVAAGFNFQPLRWLNINLNYSYRNLDSTWNEDDYDENRVFFKVVLSSSNIVPTSK